MGVEAGLLVGVGLEVSPASKPKDQTKPASKPSNQSSISKGMGVEAGSVWKMGVVVGTKQINGC